MVVASNATLRTHRGSRGDHAQLALLFLFYNQKVSKRNARNTRVVISCGKIEPAKPPTSLRGTMEGF
ncbi:MAG: hypothetical protein F6J98_01760 [Moorea sp. SIO4G2]|nr:hypothetical protein [Moorena sp. SIO4G2]